MSAASITHKGLVSAQNEDRHASDERLALWVVADGMGGHAAGEVASELAVDAVIASFRSGSQLQEAVADAHPMVLEAIAENPALAGMGTTIVATHFNRRQYRLAWVGDSRAYHWSGKTLKQVTRDHSYLEFLLAQGRMDADSARQHPERKSLTHAIGVSEKMTLQVDTASGRLQPGDCLLLCTDGLTDELADNEIAEILAGDGQPEELCRELLAAALRSGGRDNITITAIQARTASRLPLAGLIGFGLLAFGVLGWLLLR